MTTFENILNWSLLDGSHEFPGPDGGTCINEAAIIAAGFEYKAVSSARSCPPCFSPVISQFALSINDCMDYVERNKFLMPFVTRLAGTADTFDIEYKRLHYIWLRIYDMHKQPFCNMHLEQAFHRRLEAKNRHSFESLIDSADSCGHAIDRKWTTAVDILDKAILMGNHANEIDLQLVKCRMEAAKEKVNV